MDFDAPLDVPLPGVTETQNTGTKVKRPPNSYNLFYIEQQPKLKAENPMIGGNEISRQIGVIWKGMTEEQKKPYVIEANRIREEFRRENPNYHYEKASEKENRKKGNKNLANGIYDNQALYQNLNYLNDPNARAIISIGANLLGEFILSRKDLIEEVNTFIKTMKSLQTPLHSFDDPRYSLNQ